MNTVLRQGSTATGGAGLWGKRNLLLGVQVASSLVLLTAAGMLLGGLRLAQEIDPGFDADHMLVAYVDDDATGAARAVRREAIWRRLAELPEVRSVAWADRVPFAGTHLRRVTTPNGSLTIAIDDEARLIDDQYRIVGRQMLDDIVTHDITQRIGIPVPAAQHRLLPPRPRIAGRLRAHPPGLASFFPKQTIEEQPGRVRHALPPEQRP